MSDWKDQVLLGIKRGRPIIGPQTVHIDVTNTTIEDVRGEIKRQQSNLAVKPSDICWRWWRWS